MYGVLGQSTDRPLRRVDRHEFGDEWLLCDLLLYILCYQECLCDFLVFSAWAYDRLFSFTVSDCANIAAFLSILSTDPVFLMKVYCLEFDREKLGKEDMSHDMVLCFAHFRDSQVLIRSGNVEMWIVWREGRYLMVTCDKYAFSWSKENFIEICHEICQFCIWCCDGPYDRFYH